MRMIPFNLSLNATLKPTPNAFFPHLIALPSSRPPPNLLALDTPPLEKEARQDLQTTHRHTDIPRIRQRTVIRELYAR